MVPDASAGQRLYVAQAQTAVETRPSETAATMRRGLLDAGRSWFGRNRVHFAVSRAGRLTQRPIPFDPIPRRLPESEWATLAAGLEQRVVALDHFVRDVYGDRRILRQGVVPPDLVYASDSFVRAAAGPAATASGQICVAGIDLVRVRGRWLVLEDNLRVPSGVAYALAARRATADLVPAELATASPRSPNGYGRHLRAALAARRAGSGETVLLSPGRMNPAYYEHEELGRLMGVPLVSGADVISSHRGCWWLREDGARPIATIYHRYSPEYLDPMVRQDSVIGSAFLLAAWRRGAVGLANAPTCGVADHKAVFPHVPEMIRYYLGETPILEQAPTLTLRSASELAHALLNFESHVFKPVAGSGGKGIVFGPSARAGERALVTHLLATRPGALVAQPALDVERLPCVRPDGGLEHRRADLRVFVLMGEEPWVMPGGLTRVARHRDAWLVNSSAGGGVKDTWVLPDGQCR